MLVSFIASTSLGGDRAGTTMAPFEVSAMAQFHSDPNRYLDEIRAAVPRYDELQEQTVAAIPFPPDRVLELGMGTGETTRRLLEVHDDAWVVGLDASADMVYRAREMGY